MKTLQIVSSLIFALSLMACASKTVQPTVVTGPKMEKKASPPAAKSEKYIAFPPMPEGWEKELNGEYWPVVHKHPETNSEVRAQILSSKSVGGVEFYTKSLHELAESYSAEQAIMDLSPIQFDEKRDAARFTYSYVDSAVLGAYDFVTMKSKVVIFSVPNMPEVIVRCEGTWPEEYENRFESNFHAFWFKIKMKELPINQAQ